MKARRTHKLLLILGGIAAYLLLLFLLVLVEKDAEGASILSLPLSFWYSVTTLTTVGYGDLYPVTFVGRIIGFIFQLMSLGVLAAVFSLVYQLIHGRLLPRVKLLFSRQKTWYLFPEADEASLLLAEKLAVMDKSSVVILPRKARSLASLHAVYTDIDAVNLCHMHPRPESVHVFLLQENGFANEKQASLLKPSRCKLYLLNDHEPNQIPENVTYFDPAEGTARLYWHTYPLKKPDEQIILVGSGRYGRALLEQALMINVCSPDQAVSYRLFGDWSDFFRQHPQLEKILMVNGKEPGRDSLLFREGAWNQNWQPYREADRIIFCEDDEENNAEKAFELLRYCPVRGTVYARLDDAPEEIIGFGSQRELYSPELIMQRTLNRLAMSLHENYRVSSGGNLPAWDALGSFLRRSNLASADHLFMKERILLKEDAGASQDFAKAAEIYASLSDEEKDKCRRIEHERWCRFHYLNNWAFGPIRDNAARIHPLLKPFDELSPEDQAKDDYAWELLSQAAKTD